MKDAQRHCWGCPFMWFDKDRNMRCTENETALYYFRCRRDIDPITKKMPLIRANMGRKRKGK